MSDEAGNTPFQPTKSEFAEVVKILIKEVTLAISRLEDHLLMYPYSSNEKRNDREPYRSFRASFRELFILTKNNVKDRDLKNAITVWFKQPYSSGDKVDTFEIGISFAEQYIDIMFQLGLLDLNVAEAIEYPFEALIRDVKLEEERKKLLQADLSRDLLAAAAARSPVQPSELENFVKQQFLEGKFDEPGDNIEFGEGEYYEEIDDASDD